MTAEKGARIGGLALGAAVVCAGLIGSLAFGAWGFNLVAGVLSAVNDNRVNVSTSQLESEIRELSESSTPTRRMAAADRLARWRDRRAVTALIGALHTSNAQVQRHAARALGDIGDRAALSPLTELRDHSVDPDVRQAAAAAIGVLKHRR